MTHRQHLYTGRSGQMAVMAMFLFRGYNVAVPEVDVGEDVFVVRDADGDLSRIQVKAAIAKGKTKVSGLFKVALAQLEIEPTPELHYVFTLHHGASPWHPRENAICVAANVRHHGASPWHPRENATGLPRGWLRSLLQQAREKKSSSSLLL
jgi:hypothetical protein